MHTQKSKKHHKDDTDAKSEHHLSSPDSADPKLKLVFNHETQKFEYVKASESKDLNPETEEKVWTPKEACASLLKKFPAISSELISLADGIQVRKGADISQLEDKGLKKRLARFFRSLGLREEGEGGQLSLPKRMRKDDLGSKVRSLVHEVLLEQEGAADPNESVPARDEIQREDGADEDHELREAGVSVGPARPTEEQMKAMKEAAEAGHPEYSEEEEDDDDDDDDEFGPPPPELVRDADLAGDPARNAEVQRILDANSEKDGDPFEIFGVSESAPTGEVKKRFWKLSLMVHPDKCTHKLAKDAFDILKKAKGLIVFFFSLFSRKEDNYPITESSATKASDWNS